MMLDLERITRSQLSSRPSQHTLPEMLVAVEVMRKKIRDRRAGRAVEKNEIPGIRFALMQMLRNKLPRLVGLVSHWSRVGVEKVSQ